MLTKGEGWHAGHSLKDFGTKHSRISKMPSSVDEENAFDESWNFLSGEWIIKTSLGEITRELKLCRYPCVSVQYRNSSMGAVW